MGLAFLVLVFWGAFAVEQVFTRLFARPAGTSDQVTASEDQRLAAGADRPGSADSVFAGTTEQISEQLKRGDPEDELLDNDLSKSKRRRRRGAAASCPIIFGARLSGTN